MRKIPTVLVRNPKDRAHVLGDQLTPGCEWITEAEPTRKYDGTCTMYDGEKWWARRAVKMGKPYPPNYVAEDTDPVTGITQGWEPIEQSSFAQVHAEALRTLIVPIGEEAGTYELCGPKVNGNPEKLDHHTLISHTRAELAPRYASSDPLRAAHLAVRHATLHQWEGIVWHHPDGRMAKLKVRDLGGTNEQ